MTKHRQNLWSGMTRRGTVRARVALGAAGEDARPFGFAQGKLPAAETAALRGWAHL